MECKNEGLCVIDEFDRQLRVAYYSTPRALAGIFKMAQMAMIHPVTMLHFIRRRMMVDDFPRRLALSWVKLSMNNDIVKNADFIIRKINR